MPAGELHAYLDGVRAGTFRQTSQGSLTFEYDDRYRGRRGATPMSLSMPLTRGTHRNAVARAYLQGLLPDNDGRLKELGALYKVNWRNPFALLTYIGQDAPGAVQLLPPGADSPDAATRTGDVVVHTDEGRWATPQDATPTTHILKPAVPPYTEHHVNEYMTMQAARHLGLDVATSDLITTLNGHHVFVSARYDRAKVNGRWRRLHQEDLCQALGVPPEKKYQSDGGPGVAAIAELFRGLRLREDREQNAFRFLEALAFNLAAAGTDAHAKNYSLLLDGASARLAPLYDLGTHAPYPTSTGKPFELAMSLDGEYVMDRVGVAALLHAADRLSIDEDAARPRVVEILRGVTDAFDQAATDTRKIMGDHPSIGKVRDAVAQYAAERGWRTIA